MLWRRSGRRGRRAAVDTDPVVLGLGREGALVEQWLSDTAVYDLRVTDARAKPLADGRYEVSAALHAEHHPTR